MSQDASGHFTRGGQIFAHKVRMLAQVGKVALYMSLGVVCVWAMLSLLWVVSFEELYLRGVFEWGQAKLELARLLKGPDNLSRVPLSIYRFGSGWERWGAEVFVSHPQVILKVKRVDQALCHWVTMSLLVHGIWCFILTYLVTTGLFVQKGRKKQEKVLERGARVVDPQVMASLVKKKKRASDLTFDQVPLVKNSETSHLLLTGTTGSGKTNGFHTLLPQIRARGDRAVIVDLTGDYVRRYYREGHDILINPYDRRSLGWSPWEECLYDSHYDTLAAAIVPSTSSHDTFWRDAGKTVLKAALQKLALESSSVLDLYHLLVCEDFGNFTHFFQGTEAASYTHKEGDKMTHSIRATLANHVKFLKLLDGFEKTFSMRRWIQGKGQFPKDLEEAEDLEEARDLKKAEGPRDQWVFLGAKADQRESLRPFFSALIDTGITALMSAPPDPNRRVWFVMDELPAMNKLPSLETGLAELRKYGGCLMCGVQSVSQLETAYSPQAARTILGLFNTKLFFRSLDPATTSWVSRSLGEAETSEHIENVSYGANTIRDGVSLNKSTQTKPIVMPSELSTLEDLSCYLKVAGAFPVTKLKMTYKNLTASVTPFEAKRESHEKRLQSNGAEDGLEQGKENLTNRD